MSSKTLPAVPRFAIISADIRRDLIAPLRYFRRLEITHFYRRAPYQDLVAEDWNADLVCYDSPQQLYRLIRQAHPDVVQAGEPFGMRPLPYLYSVYLAARSRNLPLVVPTLENRPLKVKYGPALAEALKILLRPVFAYASLIIYLNQGALANIRMVGNYEAKAQHLMYGTWGVDPEEFAPGPKRAAPAVKRILFVGRLAQEKGVFDLLTAFGKVHSAFPAVQLTLIGDGPDRGEAEAKAASAPWGSSVRLLGTVKNRDVPAHFRDADIFVAPSITTPRWEEQVGMTNIQAMACGVPVVSTKSGAIPEYVPDGVAGILVPERDPEALAQALLRLLRDDELRDTLGQQARTYTLQHYNAEESVRRAEAAILEHCLGQ
ncbi:MAG: glycosyltransferase [Anaerolineae bacterium]|nr:glycosyltransferase [Anaerolineae bacterium]